MIIGVDIRPLAVGRRSGIQEYTEQLLAHLLPLDPSITYRLFYSSWRMELPAYPWLTLPNVELVARRIPNRVLFWSGRLCNAPTIDTLIGGCDVFFSPHLFLAPLSPWVKRVTTYHDLSFERFPEFFSLRQRLWHRLEMRPRWQARFSHRIIAVSDSTKADIVSLYGIDPANIERIYSGVAEEFAPARAADAAAFRAAQGLPERYVLFLGTREPRKNVQGVLAAFELLGHDPALDDVELVVAGGPGWLCGDLPDLVRRSPAAARIRFVDYVDDRSRAMLYASASAFVYPSFLEGFGFPPLEAMACGTPVVTSDSSSLAEVAGDAALLVHPYRASDIAFALRQILTDSKLAADLSKKGLARAREFSWDRTARETLEILVR